METRWTDYFKERLDEILNEIRMYVEHESPTHRKDYVDGLGEKIAQRFAQLGCRVTRVMQAEYGNQLLVEYGDGDEQILVLGHFDTVKEVGTLAREPWRIEGNRAYGPGSYDMKAGIVFSYFALKAIIETGAVLNRKIVFFWNTDEEAGSPSSADIIADLAKQSIAALVLEPAHNSGALKTSRKSGGEFVLKVTGRAAHAGNDHHLGVNAIAELAQHIVDIQSWTDYEKGTTLSVGVVRGGTASNVVPDYAEAYIDVRVSTVDEARAITERMHSLRASYSGATLAVEGGINKTPMERTAGTARLFELAKTLGAQEGYMVSEIGVGGTSDGNFTAHVGTPTLDGLGAAGDGAHAVDEHILIDEIPRRIALLLRLLTTI